MERGKTKDETLSCFGLTMKITLISPRIAVQKGDFFGSGVPYWPIELAILSAFLRDRGDEISVIDLFGSSPTTLEEVDDHYLQGKPFESFTGTPSVAKAEMFILFALSYMAHREILSIARTLKGLRPDITLCVLENSYAVTAYSIPQVAEDFFQSGVYALLCGEVYWNWDEILEFLKNKNIAKIPENVLTPVLPKDYKIKRKINKNPTYPIPEWDLFNLKNYWSIPYSHGPKTKQYFPILTSRGCPYSCDFCVVPETNLRQWRGRAPEEVVKEMIILRDRFGVRHFQIEDLNPTVNGARWEEICRLLIEQKAGIFFYFVSGTKAETIQIDQIPLYAEAGCRYISISPESGSPNVVKAMGKSFDHTHGLRLIEACHKYGIYTQACFLVGHPSESPEDHRLSCEYLRAMVCSGLDEVAVFVIAPFAGSLLYKHNSIKMTPSTMLTSFSPKGREGWNELSRRRKELVRIFFTERLKRGAGIWIQGIRALLGIPRTKMENLPRRIMFIYSLVLKYYIQRLLTLK
ncbi:MAG: B12-binding domain-containing radical SAM protein [Nitrospira sp.]|nr:B12-binding domain-containing radical SAM protein [Nitrospira sp.]